MNATTPAVTLSAAAQKAYAIPLIDLADQTHRQVIVDRQEGIYLGHPSTCLLEDDHTMLAVYPQGHGHGQIFLKRSSDAGLTWSQRLPTPASWITSQETPILYRTTDAAGKKHILLFTSRYPVRLSVSEDDGQSWSPLAPIGQFGGTVAMADMHSLGDGQYLAFFQSMTWRTRPITAKCNRCSQPATRVCGVSCWIDDHCYYCDSCTPQPDFGEGAMLPIDFTPRIAPDAGTPGIFTTLSTDGGLTWQAPRHILPLPANGAKICEPGLVVSPDGKTLAILLRENSRKHNSFISFSNDQGSTWFAPRELPSAITGDRHQASYAPDGRLVVSFRDMTHGSPTRGDWIAWVGRWEDLVNGNEGQYRIRLMDNHNATGKERDWDCGYPGIHCLNDGTFVVTSYGNWVFGQQPYIVSVRFKLDEIDKLAQPD